MMRKPLIGILALGATVSGVHGAGTIYTLNFSSATAWNLDWTDASKYLPDSGYPNAAGDRLEVTAGNSGNFAPNTYNLNGDKTIGQFRKTLAYGKDTAIQPGTPATSKLIWDTGNPSADALFEVFGSGNNANNGDLRCASFVDMHLRSNLEWKGASLRDYATTNGRLSGNISGRGKLTVWWNSNRSVTTATTGRHMALITGSGNSHVGGTVFRYFHKTNNSTTGTFANRAGFLLAKEQATGLGNTTVNGDAEIYIDTNLGTQGAIHDTTSLDLLTGATVQLANGVNETVSGLYFRHNRGLSG